MSSTTGIAIGTRTALTTTGLGTLASATYVTSNALDLHNVISSANAPTDVIVELEATPGTVSGNKQAILFAQVSMDGTNYSTGPGSGTTTTDQPDLYTIGFLPLNTNTTQQRKGYSVLGTVGFIPYAIKFVVFNDSGAAFSAGAINYTFQSVNTV